MRRTDPWQCAAAPKRPRARSEWQAAQAAKRLIPHSSTYFQGPHQGPFRCASGLPEWDALPPRELRALLKARIEDVMDLRALARCQHKEKAEQKRLRTFVDGLAA